MRPAVSYIRVSKPKQGRSGLGLEAQQAAIKTFCAQHGYKIEDEYREVETGKGADALERRPQLAAARSLLIRHPISVRPTHALRGRDNSNRLWAHPRWRRRWRRP